LNPLDILPVGTPKIPVDNEQVLHHLIVDACQTIRSHPERMLRSVMRRVEECTEFHDGHFEN
jgi:hypothetical protein